MAHNFDLLWASPSTRSPISVGSETIATYVVHRSTDADRLSDIDSRWRHLPLPVEGQRDFNGISAAARPSLRGSAPVRSDRCALLHDPAYHRRALRIEVETNRDTRRVLPDHISQTRPRYVSHCYPYRLRIGKALRPGKSPGWPRARVYTWVGSHPRRDALSLWNVSALQSNRTLLKVRLVGREGDAFYRLGRNES